MFHNFDKLKIILILVILILITSTISLLIYFGFDFRNPIRSINDFTLLIETKYSNKIYLPPDKEYFHLGENQGYKIYGFYPYYTGVWKKKNIPIENDGIKKTVTITYIKADLLDKNGKRQTINILVGIKTNDKDAKMTYFKQTQDSIPQALTGDEIISKLKSGDRIYLTPSNGQMPDDKSLRKYFDLEDETAFTAINKIKTDFINSLDFISKNGYVPNDIYVCTGGNVGLYFGK